MFWKKLRRKSTRSFSQTELQPVMENEIHISHLISQDQIHIYRISLSNFYDKIESFEKVLSSDELQKAYRYKFENDKKKFIVARTLLRIISGKYLNIEPSLINFFYKEKGKPYLKGTNLKFNLSHSNDSAVYAFTSEKEVGIDIEYVREMPDAIEIAKRFFSKDEVAALKNSENVKESFFTCWTRKEAFIKAVGEGLSYPLKDFSVNIEPGKAPKFLSIKKDKSVAAEWSLYNINVQSGYISALAVRASKAEIVYKEI